MTVKVIVVMIKTMTIIYNKCDDNDDDNDDDLEQVDKQEVAGAGSNVQSILRKETALTSSSSWGWWWWWWWHLTCPTFPPMWYSLGPISPSTAFCILWFLCRFFFSNLSLAFVFCSPKIRFPRMLWGRDLIVWEWESNWWLLITRLRPWPARPSPEPPHPQPL